MGYLVILYVKDKDAVKKVVTREDRTSSVRPVGVFRYPHKPATCAGTCRVRASRREPDWIKSKTGELVHRCGNLHPAWRIMLMRGIQNALGFNLLKSAPRVFRTERKKT